MAWTVAQNCSSIVTKRESPRHCQRTKQALGIIRIVSTLKRNALGRNHNNTVEEKHWVEITLCQYRQRRRHWAEITVCQPLKTRNNQERAHSVSRLTVGVKTNVPQASSTLVTMSQECTLRLYCKTGVSSGKVAFSAVTSLLENFPLEFGAAFTSMSSKVF